MLPMRRQLSFLPTEAVPGEVISNEVRNLVLLRDFFSFRSSK